MRKLFFVTILASLTYSPIAFAQFVVIDPWTAANTGKISETADGILTTDKEISTTTKSILDTDKQILDTDKKILDTVEKTLKAVTGDRTADSGKANTAAGQSFTSASSTPSLASQAAKDAIDNITKMVNTKFDITGKSGDGKTNNPSLQASATTTVDLGAIISGILKASIDRDASLQQASQQIGTTQDLKGSVDQNSQLQVQNGKILNEIVGALNGNLASSESRNRKDITNTFGS
ncbi:MAG TPA: hypothetical protein VN150_09615, partial [Ochrobactrum sp.]|nr:hypothetical protein [Ochrobactrum sp.]